MKETRLTPDEADVLRAFVLNDASVKDRHAMRAALYRRSELADECAEIEAVMNALKFAARFDREAASRARVRHRVRARLTVRWLAAAAALVAASVGFWEFTRSSQLLSHGRDSVMDAVLAVESASDATNRGPASEECVQGECELASTCPPGAVFPAGTVLRCAVRRANGCDVDSYAYVPESGELQLTHVGGDSVNLDVLSAEGQTLASAVREPNGLVDVFNLALDHVVAIDDRSIEGLKLGGGTAVVIDRLAYASLRCVSNDHVAYPLRSSTVAGLPLVATEPDSHEGSAKPIATNASSKSMLEAVGTLGIGADEGTLGGVAASNMSINASTIDQTQSTDTPPSQWAEIGADDESMSSSNRNSTERSACYVLLDNN